MARAGALAWDFSFNELQTDCGPLLDDRGWLTVRVLRSDHQSPEFWSEQIESVRAKIAERSREGLAGLRKALSGRQCTGELVGLNYSISSPPEYQTTCLPSCGGCAYCRRNGRSRWSSPAPRPRGVEVAPRSDPTRLNELAAEGTWGPRLIVGAEPSMMHSRRKLRRAIRSLVAAGSIQLLVVPDGKVDAVEDLLLSRNGERPPLMVDSLGEFDPRLEVGVPTLVIVDEGIDPEPSLAGSARSSLLVVLGPSDLPVGTSGLSLIDCDGAIRVDDLERLL